MHPNSRHAIETSTRSMGSMQAKSEDVHVLCLSSNGFDKYDSALSDRKIHDEQTQTAARSVPEASLKRAEAMELGQTAVRTIRKAEYAQASLYLVVGNSLVESDVVLAFTDRTFVQN